MRTTNFWDAALAEPLMQPSNKQPQLALLKEKHAKYNEMSLWAQHKAVKKCLGGVDR